jgi:hypothetical protein
MSQTVWLSETHQFKDVKLSTLSKIAGALGVLLPDSLPSSLDLSFL